MSNKKLKVIDKIEDINNTDCDICLYKDNNIDLYYLNDSSHIVNKVEFSGYSNLFEALTVNNLSQKLIKRDWNKSDTLIVLEKNSKLSFLDIVYDQENSRPAGFIDEIDLSSVNLEFPGYLLSGKDFNISEYALIKSEYFKIIENYPEIYKNSDLDVDFKKYTITSHIPEEKIDLGFISFNTSTTVNLVGEDEYTNTINLNDISGNYGIAEIIIKYSINNTIYSYSTCIDIFGNNVIEDIKDINDNKIISLEYIEKVLKAIPINNEINECIINNCRITYGYRI